MERLLQHFKSVIQTHATSKCHNYCWLSQTDWPGCSIVSEPGLKIRRSVPRLTVHVLDTVWENAHKTTHTWKHKQTNTHRQAVEWLSLTERGFGCKHTVHSKEKKKIRDVTYKHLSRNRFQVKFLRSKQAVSLISGTFSLIRPWLSWLTCGCCQIAAWFMAAPEFMLMLCPDVDVMHGVFHGSKQWPLSNSVSKTLVCEPQ